MSTWPAVAASLAIMAAFRLTEWFWPGSQPPGVTAALVVGLVAALALVARAAGLGLDDLGLARDTWRQGARWAVGAAAAVAAVVLVASALPAARHAVAGTGDSRGLAVVTALVVIPLGTVVPEEFAFRGVLWGLLRRERGTRFATVVSSVLFGLWHVPAALAGGAANSVASDVTGTSVWGVLGRVAGTVLFTGVSGVVFCELRRRSGSLLAPIGLHWSANGFGELAAAR